MFQFTCPSRSTTSSSGKNGLNCSSFNSRAPRGARPSFRHHASSSCGFNSRAPRGARRDPAPGCRGVPEFQFTCPSRSTTIFNYIYIPSYHVSIHVPLAEHDRPSRARWMPLDWFQFTCPSRSTTTVTVQGDRDWKFQFTCPSRSTTCITAQERLNQVFQFTCPSRSTTTQRPPPAPAAQVSIHVPLAEHDGLSRAK